MDIFAAMGRKKAIVTLKQVSEASGVSIGTVDRIIHNRGRVSKDTEERVRRTIEELGYTANIHAAMLSVRKELRIAIVIPYYQTGEFWAEIYKGAMKALGEFGSLDITANCFYYNQFDVESFKKAGEECEDWNPGALLLAPIHKDESVRLVRSLYAKGVATVFVDTRIDAPYLGYYGIDLFQSAYMMADLIFSLEHPEPGEIAFCHVDRQNCPGNESMSYRRSAMQKYIDDHGINCKILDCNISVSDFLGNVKTLDSFFEAHPDVKVMTTSSSRAHILSDWKEIRGRKDLSVYGYDAIQANMSALERGAIRLLICEHTEDEAYQAMKCLIENVALGLWPEKKDNLFPIDVLTIHNAKYYL